MNRIILLGRLTKEPEVRYTNTGKVVASFTLAVDRPFTGQDGKREADFIPVVIWGKPAETIGNYVQKALNRHPSCKFFTFVFFRKMFSFSF